MTNRNSQSRENLTQAKQAYLREHVPQEKYEDFGEFCEAVAGNIDIEGWSIEYVRELVDRFKRSEDQKEKNKKKTGSFHIYQTGNANDIKYIAQRLKDEQQSQDEKQENNKNERIQVKGKGQETGKVKEEKSALQVLDSIFENHPASEYETKKYDKAFFESCNFWEVPTNQQPAHKEQKEKGTPIKSKQNVTNQIKFTSNSLVLQPQNFEKMFQTGLAIPQQKQPRAESKQKTPKKPVFQEIPIEQQPPKQSQPQKIQNRTITNYNKIIANNGRQSEAKKQIKLVSVKDIKNLKHSKIPYDGQVLIREPFKDTIACFKSFQRQALSVKDLKVEIVNHQIINRSFFSSDYPMYHLRVHPANITCKRNFQDFQKLKKNLENVYPGVRLPYLEKLGWLESEISPQYITKQKKYLNYFLEDILQHDQLRNSRIMQDFLTLKDHKQMKRKFQEYDKIKKISSMEELCLLQGEVKVEITEVNRQYNELLEAFLGKVKHFWVQEERILTEINQMHIKLSSSYKELQILIQEISQQSKDFNRRVNINEFECLEDAFKNLNEYVGENIKVNEKQSDFLQNSVLVYLRYQKENMNMFDSVFDIRSNLTRCYLKRKESEKSNDNIEYLSQRLKDYKTDILQESKNITVLKYQCGYINNLLASEGQRYFKFLSEKMEKMISDVCYSKLQYLSKTINTYTSLVYS